MLKTLPKTLTDGKQKSLIHEEGLAEAGATCGAVKLDQSDLGLHLTQRMDWKLHGKNTTPNRDCCVQENSALWMKWCQGFCLCVTVMWFMSCLGGIHDIYWLITCYLPRVAHLLNLPISGWAELPQQVLSVGRAGRGSSSAAAETWGHSAVHEDSSGSLSKEWLGRGGLLLIFGCLGLKKKYFTSYDLKHVYSKAIFVIQMGLRCWWNFLVIVWANARNNVLSGVNRQLEPGVFQHKG